MTDEQTAAQIEIKAKQERFLFLCYAVFKQNPEGKELFETLRESLIEKTPVADPESTDKHAFYREGQNSIVRSFGANIESYEKVARANAAATSKANA